VQRIKGNNIFRQLKEKIMEEKQKPRSSSTDSDAGELESFLCAITSQVMKDPVSLEDGHSYERGPIEEWLKDHNTSPKTNKELTSKELKPNYSLRQAIEEYQKRQAELRQKLNEAKQTVQEIKENSSHGQGRRKGGGRYFMMPLRCDPLV
jgi:hypothetical protein